MYQLHTSALLDIRVATKDQNEGHSGLQEIHLHLKLPSFLIESSTSLKKGGGRGGTNFNRRPSFTNNNLS